MQFGKFHGWAFITLGVLLIVVQAVLFFSSKRDATSSPEPPAVVRRTTPVPGIIGGLSLIVGIGLSIAHRNRVQE